MQFPEIIWYVILPTAILTSVVTAGLVYFLALKLKSGKSAEWLIPAMKVRRDYPLKPEDVSKCQSVGIPTWSYGHEPPNVSSGSGHASPV